MKKLKSNLLKIFLCFIIIITAGLIIISTVHNNIEKNKIENVIEEDIIENNTGYIEEDTLTGGSEYDENNLEVEGFEESNPDIISKSTREIKEISIGNSQVINKPVYYSQIDSRWKNILYTSVGNPNQTIGSSGCGPTSAAMIVAGLKDSSVTPETMAKLFVDNGFRSASNGTYFSAFKWTANVYDIDYKQLYNVDDALQEVKNGYYEIVSCSEGLFTTGGHYIVISGVSGDVLKIYDPYLYSGKFDSSSRRGKVTVSGNTVYCSVNNFKKYANSKGWFAYKPNNQIEQKYKQGQRVLVNEPIAIAYDGGTDVIVDNGLNQFWINKSVITSDNRLYGLATVVWDEGNRVLVQMLDKQFWVHSSSLSTEIPQTNNNSSNEQTSPKTQPETPKYVLGKYVTNTNLNVRSGPSTKYRVIKTYKKGTRFDTKEIKGDWAKTPSGWVNLNYCSLVKKY